MILVLIFAPLLFAFEDDIDGFKAYMYRNAMGDTIPYRLFVPHDYNKQKSYPLILWLHGSGGAGADNIAQISEDQISGTRIWTEVQAQKNYPTFVLAPQNPGNWVERLDGLTGKMLLVLELLDHLEIEFNIDAARIYVVGQSDGGYGRWNLVTQKPELFAAAILVCGAGDPRLALRVAKMPLWVFHGERDDVVPVAESRKMIAAVRKAGGRPKYTEYARVGHDVWARAFMEPELVHWLFAQHR